MFSHDTELSLLAVVDLVNSAPECGGIEAMPDEASVQAFVERHHISAVDPRDFPDLNAMYGVRERLRSVFGVYDVSTIATRVNALLGEAAMSPRLTNHHDYGWHVHYFSPGATLAEHVAVDGGMALAQVVAMDETNRLRVCDAPDCCAVLIDLSRNRSKRYCDARGCGNRLNVAAYRERKRLGHALEGA
jgi:predicted RNA-binding Zn ribbon-like protein